MGGYCHRGRGQRRRGLVRESHQADSYPACAGQERSVDSSSGDMVNAENAILEVHMYNDNFNTCVQC